MVSDKWSDICSPAIYLSITNLLYSTRIVDYELTRLRAYELTSLSLPLRLSGAGDAAEMLQWVWSSTFHSRPSRCNADFLSICGSPVANSHLKYKRNDLVLWSILIGRTAAYLQVKSWTRSWSWQTQCCSRPTGSAVHWWIHICDLRPHSPQIIFICDYRAKATSCLWINWLAAPLLTVYVVWSPQHVALPSMRGLIVPYSVFGPP
jgi:hypothetical protein